MKKLKNEFGPLLVEEDGTGIGYMVDIERASKNLPPTNIQVCALHPLKEVFEIVDLIHLDKESAKRFLRKANAEEIFLHLLKHFD